METIFDHNLTDTERDYFREESKYSTRSNDGVLWDLSMLFWFRNDSEKASYYGNQIKDFNTKNDLFRTINHPC